MAQASYTTDLTTLTTNEASTSMAEPTATGWTALSTVTSNETDFYIQQAACTSAIAKAGVGGLLYNNGAGFTIPTDGAVLCWAYCWSSGLLDTEANGGVRQIIGSGSAAFYWVSQGGSNTWTYGGWLCLAMADPSAITVNTVGSPTSTRQYTGWTYNMTASPNRGNAYGVDAIRYGRCSITVTNGDATEYGRFDVIAEYNDKNSTAARTGFTLKDSGYHRFGLFQYQDGSYKWQGKLELGSSGTAVDFRDSNRLIFVLNTKNVTANFNLIEVLNASSNVVWTGISIQALGTVSKGRFLVSAAATIDMNSCTFTDMDTFVFNASGTSTADDTIWRRCGQVTGGANTFTKCTFDASTSAYSVTTADLAKLVNCNFVSDGSNTAVYFTGTAGTYDWTCTATGYATGSSGNGVQITGGSITGNEHIYITATTGTFTISVASGATVPSVASAGATVNVSSGSVTVKARAVTESGTAISGARIHLEADTGGALPYNVTVTISNSGTTATVTHTAHSMETNDKVVIRGASLDANNGVFTITKIDANSYSYTMGSTPGSSPTGTIKATWVAISDTTDGTGYNTTSVSRVFASNQPVTGRIRKSTSAPYYKQAALSGTITTGGGGEFTGVMISDD